MLEKNPKNQSILLEKSSTLIKSQKGMGIAILTPKEMIQRLPFPLVELKAGNTSTNWNSLNEVRRIIYLSYSEREVTKKVYGNKMN